MEMAAFSKLFGQAALSGLILFNSTFGYRKPGDKAAAAVFNTGDAVELVPRGDRPVEAKNGGVAFFEVTLGSATVWVPESAIHLFGDDDNKHADDYVGAFPLDFYRRAAKNTNEQARVLGARGLMRLLQEPALLEAWEELQHDGSVEVVQAANDGFAARLRAEGVPAGRRFNAALRDAVLRARCLCGLDDILAMSSDPEKGALEWSLWERGLADEPTRADPRDVARARVLLEQGLSDPDDEVRRTLIAEIAGSNASTDTVRLLTERFPAMTPEDKEEVVSDDWGFSDWEAARPLERRIRLLLDDRDLPDSLRLLVLERVFDDGYPPDDKQAAIREVVDNPSDGLRLKLAAGHCEDKSVLSEIADRGDAAAFDRALACLDEHLGKPESLDLEFHESLSEWSKPSLSAELAQVPPERRAPLEGRLKRLLGETLYPVSMPSGGD